MPVRIRIYGQEATFSQGRWACEDESLAAMLEALSDPRAMTADEEERHALYAAGRYGGAVFRLDTWEAAPLPEPEVFFGEVAPKKPPAPGAASGFLGLFRRRGGAR